MAGHSFVRTRASDGRVDASSHQAGEEERCTMNEYTACLGAAMPCARMVDVDVAVPVAVETVENCSLNQKVEETALSVRKGRQELDRRRRD